ncbi:sensor domain-containing diguanylate cyclase [Caldalkalibacillus mannanilyticus]|uniref:sensor domain-containing diguanylate cyclase n=1 Tax=Caldalkalibacillus mannanilyticus TaxID=1418 RepID=UPI000469B914|nr:sensor domain-containing diguanylate cyclase [Caldalkalibacillus mannanilyticus]
MKLNIQLFPLIHVETMDYKAILLFFILMIVLYCYPMKMGNVQITLKLMISLTVFLLFGFLIEVIMTLFGYLTSLFLTQRTISKKEMLNHLMLLLMSFFSASAFYLGVALNPASEYSVIPYLPICMYVFTAFISNHLLYGLVEKMVGQARESLGWEQYKWDVLMTLFSIPVAIFMYTAYLSELGLYGVIIVAIPAMTFALLFYFANHVENVNRQMEVIHDITSMFTTELDIDRNAEAILQAIQKLYPYDTCYILLLDEEENILFPLRYDSKEPYSEEEMLALRFSTEEGVLGKVIRAKKGLMMNQAMDYYLSHSLPTELKDNQSLLLVPLKMKNRVVGMIILGSYNENAFTRREMTLIEILSHYAATAIENAHVFQRTERRALVDELTGLYNYRGFQQQLEVQIEFAYQKSESLALLLIDIDHFKEVNDQFGHVMGNRVIEHVSRFLKKTVRKKDVVARYGGEEFTIILPQTTLEESIDIAERIRQALPTKPIRIRDDLQSGAEIFIQSTVSIGIAVYPDHAEDGLTLIRHADRAMYTGAKQAGRNRVAVYEVG